MGTFHPGQEVLRYMGVAGGYWRGIVKSVSDERIVVQFGGSDGMSMGFANDEHIMAVDDPLAAERVAAAQQAQLVVGLTLDEPMWPDDAWAKP